MQPEFNKFNKACAFVKATSYIENRSKTNFTKSELEILDAKFEKYAKCISEYTKGQGDQFANKAWNEIVAIRAELHRINQAAQLNKAPIEDPALHQARNHRGFIELRFAWHVKPAEKRGYYHQLLKEAVQEFPDRKIYVLRPSSDNRLAVDTINNPSFGESELRKVTSTILHFENEVWAIGNMSNQRYSSIDEAIEAFFGDPNFVSYNELYPSSRWL